MLDCRALQQEIDHGVCRGLPHGAAGQIMVQARDDRYSGSRCMAQVTTMRPKMLFQFLYAGVSSGEQQQGADLPALQFRHGTTGEARRSRLVITYRD
jgi:hypothetical protein